MNNKARYFDVIERSLTGPVMSEADFDMKCIYKGIKKVVKKYDINIKEDTIINMDKDLSDRVWEASIEFLAGCGVYSKDTGRVIRYTEDEIRYYLQEAPSEAVYGEGRDAVLEVTRTPDDSLKCVNNGGPGEHLAPGDVHSLMASYMQEPLVEMHCPVTLEYNINGSEIRTKSPLEVAAAYESVSLFQHVASMYGRPGMPHHGIGISVSDIGHLAAGHKMHQTDSHCYGIISELKADNTIFNKMAHIIMMDAVSSPYANPVFGGMGGGLSGQIVLLCAEMIALSVFFMATTCGSTPVHPIYFCSTTKEILQQISVAFQAVAEHSNLLTRVAHTMVGGPVTKTLLYETIASTLVCYKAGISQIDGPRSATGVIFETCTGLEARFQGEVIRAAAKIDRATAEEIVQKAYALYKDDLDKKPYGKPFAESYDVKRLKPTEEWQKMYEEVKEEVKSWGLPL